MKTIDVNLFLDDFRVPYDKKDKSIANAYLCTSPRFEKFRTEQWIIVRTYQEFIDFIKTNGVPTFIAFDHDLADVHYIHSLSDDVKIDYDNYTEFTGYHCAKWLCDYCQDHGIKFPDYYVHSMNTTGKRNIITYIENYKKHVEG